MKLKRRTFLLLCLTCLLAFSGCAQAVDETVYLRVQETCAEPIGMISTYHALKFSGKKVEYELTVPQTGQEYRKVYGFEKKGSFIFISIDKGDTGRDMAKLKVVGDTLISSGGDRYIRKK